MQGSVGNPVQQAHQTVGNGNYDSSLGAQDRVFHWTELYDPRTRRLTTSRPPGAPAGHWPHTPWWHCKVKGRMQCALTVC